MLVTATHQIFERAHMGFHLGGGGRAVSALAGVQYTLMRLHHVRLIAHRITDAVMLAGGEDADGVPEHFQHFVAACARDDTVKHAVLFEERRLIARRIQRFHAHDRRFQFREVFRRSVKGGIKGERGLDGLARLQHRGERHFVQSQVHRQPMRQQVDARLTHDDAAAGAGAAFEHAL